MGTTVVSGRVDESVKAQADRYLRRAGMTAGDAIKALWTYIANAGQIPQELVEHPANERDQWEKFMEFRGTLPRSTWLATLDDEQMKEMIASRYA